MHFPAAPVGRAWPPLALPLAVTHRSRHMAQLFCRRRRPPRSSRLTGEAALAPAQSSLAQPGFVLQLQPVLLPVLAQLRPKFGTQETWVASGTGRSREKHHSASDAHQVR